MRTPLNWKRGLALPGIAATMVFGLACVETTPSPTGPSGSGTATPTAPAATRTPTAMPTEEPTDAPPEQGTVVDVAAADGRFTTLIAALETADLAETLEGEGPFTVFAPTDDAFAAVPEEDLSALLNDVPALREVLLYHVASGEAMAEDVVEMDSVETLQGSSVDVRVEGSDVYLNDAQVILTDVQASNGVIHVIDAVLMPEAEDQTIAEIAAGDERFTTLVSALEAAGLVETLGSDGPFTVFAPTDEAFAALPEGTLDALLADTDALRDVLLYHVVPGEVTSEQVATLESAETAQGQDVAIAVQNGEVHVNDARVIETDIEASNGVIHVIDAVLTPPAQE